MFKFFVLSFFRLGLFPDCILKNIQFVSDIVQDFFHGVLVLNDLNGLGVGVVADRKWTRNASRKLPTEIKSDTSTSQSVRTTAVNIILQYKHLSLDAYKSP